LFDDLKSLNRYFTEKTSKGPGRSEENVQLPAVSDIADEDRHVIHTVKNEIYSTYYNPGMVCKFMCSEWEIISISGV
jgi:hypothetical protein